MAWTCATCAARKTSKTRQNWLLFLCLAIRLLFKSTAWIHFLSNPMRNIIMSSNCDQGILAEVGDYSGSFLYLIHHFNFLLSFSSNRTRVWPKGLMAAWPDSFQWKLRHYGRAVQAFWLRFRSHIWNSTFPIPQHLYISKFSWVIKAKMLANSLSPAHLQLRRLPLWPWWFLYQSGWVPKWSG